MSVLSSYTRRSLMIVVYLSPERRHRSLALCVASRQQLLLPRRIHECIQSLMINRINSIRACGLPPHTPGAVYCSSVLRAVLAAFTLHYCLARVYKHHTRKGPAMLAERNCIKLFLVRCYGIRMDRKLFMYTFCTNFRS